MRDRFPQFFARFDALDAQFREQSARERVLITAMAAALAFFSVDLFLLSPVSENRERAQLGIEHATESISRLEMQIRELGEVELTEEERRILEERKLLSLQIAEIEDQMKDSVATMVPPQEVVAVLEALLEDADGLHLVSLKSHPPKRLGETKQDEADPDSVKAIEFSQGALYRHALTLEIEGDYLSTLDYLERVESSPWNLLWESLEYQVEAHPKASVRIRFNTISDREEWIDV